MSSVSEIFLRLSLAFIMFALGLGLTGADFLRVLKQPKDFFVGAICQVILLPVIAFILLTIWPFSFSTGLAVGVMIIAVAPGGVTTNLLTSYSRGDVALSISLTAIISLLSVITIPFILLKSLNLLGAENIVANISVQEMALGIFLIVTVPAILGMLFRKFASNIAIAFESKAKKISTVLFIIILAGIIYEERENVIDYFAQAGLMTLTLNVVMMVVAFYVAQLLGTGLPQKKSIAIEGGLQNGTLALYIAREFFGGGEYVIPASTYSLIMFATCLIFVFFVRNINNN